MLAASLTILSTAFAICHSASLIPVCGFYSATEVYAQAIASACKVINFQVMLNDKAPSNLVFRFAEQQLMGFEAAHLDWE
mgnify:CR=1 FL=1